MRKNDDIFPIEIAKISVEQLLADMRESNLVYRFVIFTSGLLMLFLLVAKVDISTNAPTSFRPEMSNLTLTSPNAGILNLHPDAKPNAKVAKGDTLFTILDVSGANEIEQLKQMVREDSLRLSDLQGLSTTGMPLVKTIQMQTLLYAKEQMLFVNKLAEIEQRLKHYQDQVKEDSQLVAHGIRTSFEVRKNEEDLRMCELEYQSHVKTSQSTWAKEYDLIEKELAKNRAQLKLLYARGKQSVVLSPVAGTITKTESVSSQMYVGHGSAILDVSPDEKLIAESHISPKDIGLIRLGMPVRMSVDSYNYNQWGFVEGSVDKIYDDVFFSQETGPYFKVISVIDQTDLSLKNGFSSPIIKGMTGQARFMITRRTLFNILWDKVDNWINPHLKPEED